jgi:hypothetical protein
VSDVADVVLKAEDYLYGCDLPKYGDIVTHELPQVCVNDL